MSNQTHTTFAEKKSVQIAVLILAICCALWFMFFAHSAKEAVIIGIISVGVRQFFAKPISVLDARENTQYLQFKKLFSRGMIVVIFLPSILDLILLNLFDTGLPFKYGSSVMLLCSMYLIQSLLGLILFYPPLP